jgi:hypothetical protein
MSDFRRGSQGEVLKALLRGLPKENFNALGSSKFKENKEDVTNIFSRLLKIAELFKEKFMSEVKSEQSPPVPRA